MTKSTDSLNEVAGYSPEDEIDWIIAESKKEFGFKKRYTGGREQPTFASLPVTFYPYMVIN